MTCESAERSGLPWPRTLQCSNSHRRATDASGHVSRCGTARFLLRTLVIAVPFQVAVQAGASNPQNLCGPESITLAHFQHALNVQLAYLIEGQRLPIVAFQRTCAAVLQMFREIGNIDEVPRRRNARARDD